MLAIFKREFKGYFTNVTGPLFTAILLCFAGIFATAVNLYGQSAMFEYTLSNVSIVLQLLYSLPLKPSTIVLAKYFAMLAIFLISIIVMVLYPFLLSAFGIVNYASCLAALLGFFMLGAALLAISMFISSLTESQVIAAVISFGVIFVMYMMGIVTALIPQTALASYIGLAIVVVLIGLVFYYFTRNFVISASVVGVGLIPLSIFYYFSRASFEGLLPKIMSQLAVFERFDRFIYGIFDLSAIVYYVSIIVFFVFLTVQSLEKRRWS